MHPFQPPEADQTSDPHQGQCNGLRPDILQQTQLTLELGMLTPKTGLRSSSCIWRIEQGDLDPTLLDLSSSPVPESPSSCCSYSAESRACVLTKTATHVQAS